MGLQFLVFFGSLVCFVVLLDYLVGRPDRGEAGGLGGHNVDAVSEIDGKVLNTVANEFKHLVLYKARLEYCTDKLECNVLRSNAGTGCACKIYCDNLGTRNVVGLAKELLNKLRTALTDCHSTKCAVTGVAV